MLTGLFSSEIAKEELYDLRTDPHETHNLLLDSDLRLQSFREALRAYLSKAQEHFLLQPGIEITLDETVLEEMKALGYIER